MKLVYLLLCCILYCNLVHAQRPFITTWNTANAGASTPDKLSLGAAGLTYDAATAKAAHDSLTMIKGWMITGDKMANCSGMLPVDFIAFTATQKANEAQLNWSVANEININDYYVESSKNGVSYADIGFVRADGKLNNYNYVDNNINEGVNYYRIKEVDNDGSYTYSSIQKLVYSKFAWKVVGNPINNSYVQLMLDRPANISIQIVSSTGNIIKTINKGNISSGNYNIALNIDNLNTGLYFLRLMVDDKSYTTNVVKQ